MHFFDFFEFSFYIICLYTGHFIIAKFCQKAEKINFIKFWPLIKSPGPFCHSSAEPKSQIFGNFSSNLRRTNLKSLWGRHGTLIVILMYICINPKMSPIRDPVRGRKNAPIDCCRYSERNIFRALRACAKQAATFIITSAVVISSWWYSEMELLYRL